ncbi:MAG TPA: glycosyltransferase family 2 protein [Vicinamibacterales bacterium]|nr:glycosyltransferase family 2 protein [Vicinamibacterales bacterium]
MTTRVIVLNWNGLAWLDRCLESLRDQTLKPTEIVVVDNASTDGSVTHLRSRWPGVRVEVLDTNAGFAAGNNRGARGAHTDVLVFLNNDTDVDPGWLQALVRAAEADSARGLVTSKVVYLDRPELIDSAGDGYLRCGGAFKRGHGQPAAVANASREVFGACGAAFLIRRNLFEDLGGFDEDFFMVYEDVDLSYRARLSGARVWYAADAVVRHAGSGALGHLSDRAVYLGQRNLEWTWLKNTPASLWWRSLPGHLIYTLAAGLAYARRGQSGPWFRGKVAALIAGRRLWRKRVDVQRRSRVPAASLWSQMDRRWWTIKTAEKVFDFRQGSGPPPRRR